MSRTNVLRNYKSGFARGGWDQIDVAAMAQGPPVYRVKQRQQLNQGSTAGYAFDMTEGPVPIIAYLQKHDGFDVARQFLLEENLYRPLDDGPYEGEDGRTVLDEAIAWWSTQLGEIDRRT